MSKTTKPLIAVKIIPVLAEPGFFNTIPRKPTFRFAPYHATTLIPGDVGSVNPLTAELRPDPTKLAIEGAAMRLLRYQDDLIAPSMTVSSQCRRGGCDGRGLRLGLSCR